MDFDIRVASVVVVLKALSVPLQIEKKADRIAIQKAIYLAQVKGPDMGYRFSWYLNGPYSPELAEVYYQASADRNTYEKYNADPETIQKLQPIKALIEQRPQSTSLPDWLEAVGSLDFMIRVMKRPLKDSLARCKELKPTLTELLDKASESLSESGIMANVA